MRLIVSNSPSARYVEIDLLLRDGVVRPLAAARLLHDRLDPIQGVGRERILKIVVPINRRIERSPIPVVVVTHIEGQFEELSVPDTLVPSAFHQFIKI